MNGKRTLAGLALVGTSFGLAARADATEAHVSVRCDGTVSVYATDHGKTAAVSDAYVLDERGSFNGALSADLRTAFAGVVLTTGPTEGEPGPAVERRLAVPAGSRTVAITLTFSDGTTSTGRAPLVTPCAVPTTTTTVAPTTTSTTAQETTTTTQAPSVHSVAITCAEPGHLAITNGADVPLVIEWWNGLMAPIERTAVPAQGTTVVAYPNPIGKGYATGYVARWADGATEPPHVVMPDGVAQTIRNVTPEQWLCRVGTTTETSAETTTTTVQEIGTPTSMVRLPATGPSMTQAMVLGALFLTTVGILLAIRGRRPLEDEMEDSELW